MFQMDAHEFRYDQIINYRINILKHEGRRSLLPNFVEIFRGR